MAIILVALTIPNDAVGYRLGCTMETPWPAGTQPDAISFFLEKTTGKTIVVGPPAWWPVPQKVPISKDQKELSILSPCITLAHTREFYGGIKEGALNTVLERALNEDVCVTGNGRMYDLFMPYAQEIWVARVRLTLWNGSSNAKDFDHFPDIDRKDWKLDRTYTWHTDAVPNVWPTSFFHYTRKPRDDQSNN